MKKVILNFTLLLSCIGYSKNFSCKFRAMDKADYEVLRFNPIGLLDIKFKRKTAKKGTIYNIEKNYETELKLEKALVMKFQSFEHMLSHASNWSMFLAELFSVGETENDSLIEISGRFSVNILPFTYESYKVEKFSAHLIRYFDSDGEVIKIFFLDRNDTPFLCDF